MVLADLGKKINAAFSELQRTPLIDDKVSHLLPFRTYWKNVLNILTDPDNCHLFMVFPIRLWIFS
jgi:hypothetical protein